MRSFENIADEAIKRTNSKVNKKSVVIALEMLYGEVISEMYPLRKRPVDTKRPTVYILSGLKWNGILPLIKKLERCDYHCTNTAFNYWKNEMLNADIICDISSTNKVNRSVDLCDRIKYAEKQGKPFKRLKDLCV